MACGSRCKESENDLCRCSCKGKNHGTEGDYISLIDWVEWKPSRHKKEPRDQLRLFDNTEKEV